MTNVGTNIKASEYLKSSLCNLLPKRDTVCVNMCYIQNKTDNKGDPFPHMLKVERECCMVKALQQGMTVGLRSSPLSSVAAVTCLVVMNLTNQTNGVL